MAVPRFRLEFYEDAVGRKPVLDWLRKKVSISTRRVVGTPSMRFSRNRGWASAKPRSGASSAPEPQPIRR
jgi:hypothetical protein